MRKVGFEPTRVYLTDLQSAAFDHSATSPLIKLLLIKASLVPEYFSIIPRWVQLKH